MERKKLCHPIKSESLACFADNVKHLKIMYKVPVDCKCLDWKKIRIQRKDEADKTDKVCFLHITEQLSRFS